MDEPITSSVGITPLSDVAVALHELFLSFVAAGFSENQALTLVALISTNSDE